MYSDWINPVLIGAGFLAVWLLGLSFLIWQQNNFLKSLFPKSGQRDIRRKFDEVLKGVFDLKEDVDRLKDHLSQVENIGLRHVQRVELLRYNPYEDSGGDQSFSLAMLDERGNGMVITSLHARSGTRVFAKSVREGQTEKHQLSEEEKMVIEKALKNQ